RQSQGVLLERPGGVAVECRDVVPASNQTKRKLVAALARLGQSALRRGPAGTRRAGQRAISAGRCGAWALRHRTMMQISLHEIEGQTLRVGVRRGDRARPALLLFNGIGANIELIEPFLEALDGPEAIVFDVPGVGGSPSPWLPYRPSTLARLS